MSPGHPEAGASKAQWRTWARAVREEVDVAGRSSSVVAALRDWAPLREARATLIYLPLPDEIDLRPLADGGPGGTYYTTRTPDRGGELTIHRLDGPMEVHRLGFLQPHAGTPAVDPADLDVLLLPGLAFDLWGTRLGRGAGYFDRMLTGVDASAVLAGVTIPELVVDLLPREAHDVPVAYLATDEGVVGTAG